jgi:phosphocarrier protein HPr
MITRTTHIISKLGLHARPSAQLVSVTSKFQSEVFITKEGLRINAKSIMGVMMLAAEKGSELLIEADGPDEEAAVEAVVQLIQSGFGEPE